MDGLFEIVNPLSLVLHLVNLVILYIVFKKFLYKPVAKFLKDRQDKIAQERASIDQDRAEVDALKAKGDGILDDARSCRPKVRPRRSWRRRIRTPRPSAPVRRNRPRRSSKTPVRKRKRRKSARRMAMRDQVMELSVALAGRILEREINPKDHQKLMEEFLSEVKCCAC